MGLVDSGDYDAIAANIAEAISIRKGLFKQHLTLQICDLDLHRCFVLGQGGINGGQSCLLRFRTATNKLMYWHVCCWCIVARMVGVTREDRFKARGFELR
jgi:hypothetical protein